MPFDPQASRSGPAPEPPEANSPRLKLDYPGLDWQDLRAVIFDLDGTLYHQGPLRNRMRLKLLRELALSPGRWPEVRLIQCFRQVREQMCRTEASPVSTLQYELCAQKLGMSAHSIRGVVDYWMREAPLPYLAGCRAPGIRRLWQAIQGQGLKLAVVSDFEAGPKLRALGMDCSVVVSAEDPEVEVQKPNPKGFLRAVRLMGVEPGACLVIGDRPERDGEAAARAGMIFMHYAPGQKRRDRMIDSYTQLIVPDPN